MMIAFITIKSSLVPLIEGLCALTMSNGFFYEIHNDGRAPSWAFHFHGHLSSRPAVDLLYEDGRAPPPPFLMSGLHLGPPLSMGIL